MIQIPKKIKIGHITYNIIIKSIEESAMGYHETRKNIRNIVLDSSLKGKLLENVFYHELVHAILYEIGSEETDNELFVQSFANILQQVNKKIKNN
jgi:hypothetical protein